MYSFDEQVAAVSGEKGQAGGDIVKYRLQPALELSQLILGSFIRTVFNVRNGVQRWSRIVTHQLGRHVEYAPGKCPGRVRRRRDAKLTSEYQ